MLLPQHFQTAHFHRSLMVLVVGLPARVVEAFSHFVFQIALLSLGVQPSKCIARNPFGFEAIAVLPVLHPSPPQF